MRIDRSRAISHAGRSWVNMVDLPIPGAMLITRNSFWGLASSSVILLAASTDHGVLALAMYLWRK